MKWFAVCLVFLPLASAQQARPLVGKDTAVPNEKFAAAWYPTQGSSTSAPIAGAPYSATLITTMTALGAAGRPGGSSRQRTLEWRDSAGREREEEFPNETQGHPNDLAGSPHQITAVDTVQHCQFTWYVPVIREQDRGAVVNCMALEITRTDDSWAKKMFAQEHVVERHQYGAISSTTTTTPLGRRVLQGLPVLGLRSETSDVDASGKLKRTHAEETWWSPDLYVFLLATKTEANMTVTMERTDIERKEPDASLFYPPVGYPIRREAEVPMPSVRP